MCRKRNTEKEMFQRTTERVNSLTINDASLGRLFQSLEQPAVPDTQKWRAGEQKRQYL